MKKFLIIIIVLSTTILKAQVTEFICATDDIDIPNLEGVYSRSTDPDLLSSLEPVVLNVYYWRVDAPDGSVHPNALTEYRALESIAYLNINFNPIGVYFKYRGMGNFSSPPDVVHKIWDFDLDTCVTIPGPDPDGFETLSRCQRGALIAHANNNGYVEPNAINFYIPRGLTDFGGSAQGPLKSITHPGGLIKNTIVHELGHNFSLPHTFIGWQSTNPDYCEHVTRDEGNSKFNAYQKGDKLKGTDAMPSFMREYCILNGLPSSQCSYNAPYYFYYYDMDNCEYIGASQYERKDCDGTIFDISPEDAKNTMSYASGGCKDNFSTDQGIKMREHIENSSSLQLATTDIASLYEPYKGEYYFAGPLPVNDQGGLNPPLFQPGFKYVFPECIGVYPQPADYTDISFTTNYNTVLLSFDNDEIHFENITHPNHSAIVIKGLEDQARKCYNNYNRSPSGGSIIKFNDNVLNTNITLTPQDSIAINNQNLINNLENGLYKIEKTYEDGSTQETVIYKGNN
jgi:hypothetical protein